jgi:hypothetical protein
MIIYIIFLAIGLVIGFILRPKIDKLRAKEKIVVNTISTAVTEIKKTV